jgi:hypothetical protein
MLSVTRRFRRGSVCAAGTLTDSGSNTMIDLG